MSSILSIVGGVVEGMGIIKEGDQARMAGEVDAFNLRQDAENQRLAGIQNEIAFRKQSYKQIGGMKADYGASGVSASESSAADVLAESSRTAELDALNVRYESDMRSRDLVLRSERAKEMGYSAYSASRYRAAATMLGAGSKAAQQNDWGGGR